jgi:glucokinase
VTLRGGIDLGGTKIQAVVVDEAGEVLGSARHPTPTAGGPPDVAAAIVVAAREAAEQAGTKTAALLGVGVGSPGDVDSRAGTVTSARNLPGWTGTFPLAEVLGEELGTTVALGNDVDVATVAELELGAGRPYSSLLGVFWGTGVGGGVVIDRKLWRGRASAGEIGHMVVKVDGARCPCGRRGCMEAYAGRGAMEARARKKVRKGASDELFRIMEKRSRPRLTSGVFARALERHDPLATDLIDRAIEALGAGIASAVNLLDVEAVIIGGGLGTRLGQPYADRIAQAMLPHLFSDSRPPAVLLAELGDLGGAIGAALLVKARARRRRALAAT